MTTTESKPFNLTLVLEGDGTETLPYDPDSSITQVAAIDRVSDNAHLLRAVDTAGELHDSTVEAEQEASALSELRDVIEVVNERETWSPEAYTLVNLQLETMARRLGIPTVKLGPSMEDITSSNGRVCLSVEEISTILTAISESAVNLEERSITALIELINALGDAVPKAYVRLGEISELAETKVDSANLQPCQFEDSRVKQRLLVNNEIPSPLSSYINEYCKYGDTLMTKYSEVSFQSVMKAGLFQNGINDLTFAGFWDGIDEKIKQIKDPRKELTDAQLSMTLPGAGPLFKPKQDQATEALMVRDRLLNFMESYGPVSLSAFSVEIQTEEGDNSLPALPASEIRDCVRYLQDLGVGIDVKATADNCKAAWVDASRTIQMVRASMKESDESLLSALDGDDKLLPSYLSTLFMLSAWPVLNYLTNLVLTVNAFADYAQASLNAVEGETAPVGDGTGDEVVAEGGDETLPAEGETDADGAPLEEGDKPASPDEIPDTGETPDDPQDATGDGSRAVVEGVEETIETSAEEAEADTSVDLAEGGDDSTVDLGGTDDTDPDADSNDEAAGDSEVDLGEGADTSETDDEEETDKKDDEEENA